MKRMRKLPAETNMELLVLFYAAVAVVTLVLAVIFW
jgi:hypothetical protein